MKNLMIMIALTLMLGACSTVVEWKELSLINIKEVDACMAQARQLGMMQLLENPGQDFIDKFQAYYDAMNVSWAYSEQEDYDFYTNKLLAMCKAHIATMEEPPLPEVPGQEL